jgi:hypothetical protein
MLFSEVNSMVIYQVSGADFTVLAEAKKYMRDRGMYGGQKISCWVYIKEPKRKKR